MKMQIGKIYNQCQANQKNKGWRSLFKVVQHQILYFSFLKADVCCEKKVSNFLLQTQNTWEFLQNVCPLKYCKLTLRLRDSEFAVVRGYIFLHYSAVVCGCQTS